jgi:hypothetical protein
MMLRIPGAPRTVAGRPALVGPGHARKVGLIGSAPKSLACAPWQDPSWTFWSHASSVQAIPHLRADRLFDLHPRAIFTMARKNGFKDYYQWLQRCSTPIYMQDHYPEIPQSVRYPLELVRQQWPQVPIGSTTAEMIALALIEGVTHLGLWGIDYQHDSEYDEQRPNAELWVGIAIGMGVQIIIPAASPLCHEPTRIYGYESHTPELYAARLEKLATIKAATLDQRGTFDEHRLQPVESQADLDRALEVRRRMNPRWDTLVAEMA